MISTIPAPGPHGGDGAAVAAALGIDPAEMLDLSQTLNPFAPPVTVIARRHLDSLGRYPDDRAATRLLAAALGVDASRVVLTNGGAEAIAVVTGLVGGTVRAEPEFALHPRGSTGPRWASNPRNPTGELAAPTERVDVWDEAFYPLATGTWTRGDAGTIVVGSLTKLFACPGLRLGYAVAVDDDQARRLGAGRPQWSVNSLALAMLEDLLAVTDLGAWSAGLAENRARLATLLTRHGLEVRAADAPWLLVAHPDLRSTLAPHRVLVRDCTSFGLPGWTRVAVPGEEGLARLSAALDVADLATTPAPSEPS